MLRKEDVVPGPGRRLADHPVATFEVESGEEPMANRSQFHRSLLSTAASIVAVVGLISSTALAQSQSDAIVFIEPLHAAQDQLPWTEERMSHASPMPLPTLLGVAAATEAPVSPAGEVIIANSGGPGDPSRQERQGMALVRVRQ
jgi:hypothetical protein